MSTKKSSGKRIISPGLEEPSRLVRDIIYISFPTRDKNIDAIIKSNIRFSFHAQDQLQFTFTEFNPDHYDLLIEELVALNHGKVDYSRVQKEVLYPIFEAFMRDLKLGKVRV